MPTQFGLLFGAVALFMLILAMGFSNNLIYLFVFLFISFSLVSLGITNKNVDQVVLKIESDLILFENQDNAIPVDVFAKNSRIQLQEIQISTENSNSSLVSQGKARIHWRPEKYGRYPLPRIRIFSEYPFGISYAWKFFDEPGLIAVYPQKKGLSLFANRSGQDRPQGQKWESGADSDYFLHQKFQGFQSLKSVDWKKYYKLQQLLTRQRQDPKDQLKMIIHWDQTETIQNFPDRLRQMSLWISECEVMNYRYQVQLPIGHSAMSSGRQHYRQCLDLLLEMSAT